MVGWSPLLPADLWSVHQRRARIQSRALQDSNVEKQAETVMMVVPFTPLQQPLLTAILFASLSTRCFEATMSARLNSELRNSKVENNP